MARKMVNGVNIRNLDATVWRLTISDIQDIAERKFGRELTEQELTQVIEQDLIPDAMGTCWSEIVYCALDELDIEYEREECEGCGTKEELYNGYCEDCNEENN